MREIGYSLQHVNIGRVISHMQLKLFFPGRPYIIPQDKYHGCWKQGIHSRDIDIDFVWR